MARRSVVPSAPAACRVRVIDFDFASKREREIERSEIRAARAAGHFVWVDLNATEAVEAHALLGELELDPEVMQAALEGEPATLQTRRPECLHLVLSGCSLQGDELVLERLDVVIREGLLATIHRGPVTSLAGVWRDYHSDFVTFAKSPSFLLYEIWDSLIDNYTEVQQALEDRVEVVQRALRSGEVEELVFARISELSEDLLHFRKILLPARAVLTDLSTRRSVFVSEASQPFLASMVGRLEHVLQDLLVDRDILTESVNLYVSLVSHRTNEVMRRLTVVSIVFLPLSFIVGVYGMNFAGQPEVHWRHGYAYFWGLTLAVTVTLIWLMRRTRML